MSLDNLDKDTYEQNRHMFRNKTNITNNPQISVVQRDKISFECGGLCICFFGLTWNCHIAVLLTSQWLETII